MQLLGDVRTDAWKELRKDDTTWLGWDGGAEVSPRWWCRICLDPKWWKSFFGSLMFFSAEQGTVSVRFLHCTLHSLCFDICIQDSTRCILLLGRAKPKKGKTSQKKKETQPPKKTTLCHRHFSPVGLLVFFWGGLLTFVGYIQIVSMILFWDW